MRSAMDISPIQANRHRQQKRRDGPAQRTGKLDHMFIVAPPGRQIPRQVARAVKNAGIVRACSFQPLAQPFGAIDVQRVDDCLQRHRLGLKQDAYLCSGLHAATRCA